MITAMDDAGNFVIVWTDERSPGIYPAIAMEANGNFVITWMTSGNFPDVMGQRYISNGTPNGGNYLIVEDGPNHIETIPQVAANSSQIAFVWDDNCRNEFRSDIYGKLVTWDWDGVTDVEIVGNNLPDEYSLSQNYPNPFNPSKIIKFTIPHFPLLGGDGWNGLVTLKVYDVLSKEVSILVNEYKPAGTYEVEFDVGTSRDLYLPSGIYFYQIKAGNYIKTRKMLLIK